MDEKDLFNMNIKSESENLFSADDFSFLEQHEISPKEAYSQIEKIRDLGHFPVIEASASLEKGIYLLSQKDRLYFLKKWEAYCMLPEHKIIKFVPASGAASRMFQDLFPLLEKKKEYTDLQDLTEEQQIFYKNIENFAFFGELSEACLRFQWQTIHKLLELNKFLQITQSLLTNKGLNYGNLPKGLIPFHKYPNKETRTPVGEHLAEAALYLKNFEGKAHIHFTVAEEHLSLFKSFADRERKKIEDTFGVLLDISFSCQKKSTHTLALDKNHHPFHSEEGKLLLRPGGHGSLIQNLNELKGDVVFIKNIDNVTPDHLKSETILYKKLLGGILVTIQEKIFQYLKILEKNKVSKNQLEEIIAFLENTLCTNIPQKDILGETELIERLFNKLNRPIRVCGMVRNQGKAGGGPYIVKEPDGSTSLQILEENQINKEEEKTRLIWENSTFFNPVDIICSFKNYKGSFFDLNKYINNNYYFVSQKDYKGELITILERPGLWNGAMYDWNTLFIEVPTETFTPVKSVTDLLLFSHKNINLE